MPGGVGFQPSTVSFSKASMGSWDEGYISLLIYHEKSTIHAGKYTSPMDGMFK